MSSRMHRIQGYLLCLTAVAVLVFVVPATAKEIHASVVISDAGETDRFKGTAERSFRRDSVPPREWLRIRSLEVAQLADENVPSQCVIKGNINSKGERVYHVPGGRYYDRTKIDTSKGEQWFCPEAEAKAAGWRPPKK